VKRRKKGRGDDVFRSASPPSSQLQRKECAPSITISYSIFGEGKRREKEGG